LQVYNGALTARPTLRWYTISLIPLVVSKTQII